MLVDVRLKVLREAYPRAKKWFLAYPEEKVVITGRFFGEPDKEGKLMVIFPFSMPAVAISLKDVETFRVFPTASDLV